jgi:5-methyltetrahydropteroyltriglutamate--homocysteine methyltransferase
MSAACCVRRGFCRPAKMRNAMRYRRFLYQVGGVAKVQSNLNVRFHNEKGDIEFTPAAL